MYVNDESYRINCIQETLLKNILPISLMCNSTLVLWENFDFVAQFLISLFFQKYIENVIYLPNGKILG